MDAADTWVVVTQGSGYGKIMRLTICKSERVKCDRAVIMACLFFLFCSTGGAHIGQMLHGLDEWMDGWMDAFTLAKP